MITIFSDPTYMAIPILGGAAIILLVVFQRRAMALLGMRLPSEMYTIPRLQRSARINETLGRVLVVLLGIFFILQGVGPQILTPQVTYAVSIGLVTLCAVGILAMIAVTLVHSKS